MERAIIPTTQLAGVIAHSLKMCMFDVLDGCDLDGKQDRGHLSSRTHALARCISLLPNPPTRFIAGLAAHLLSVLRFSLRRPEYSPRCAPLGCASCPTAR